MNSPRRSLRLTLLPLLRGPIRTRFIYLVFL